MVSRVLIEFPSQQRSLEELDYIFAVPTCKFIAYQTGTWLPWWFKRYVLCNKRAELKPLYTFDAGTVEDIREARKQSVAAASVTGGGGDGIREERTKRDDSS